MTEVRFTLQQLSGGSYIGLILSTYGSKVDTILSPAITDRIHFDRIANLGTSSWEKIRKLSANNSPY